MHRRGAFPAQNTAPQSTGAPCKNKSKTGNLLLFLEDTGEAIRVDTEEEHPLTQLRTAPSLPAGHQGPVCLHLHPFPPHTTTIRRTSACVCSNPAQKRDQITTLLTLLKQSGCPTAQSVQRQAWSDGRGADIKSEKPGWQLSPSWPKERKPRKFGKLRTWL